MTVLRQAGLNRATTHRGAHGFTLIELMVGMVVGFLVILVVTTVFTNATAQRRDMERTGRQIENGRYAMQMLSDDIVNAGYYGELNPNEFAAPAAKPDPCSTSVTDMKNMIRMHVQGYPNAAVAGLTCLADVKNGTAAIAVRRTETCTPTGPGANCDAVAAGRIYLQSSLCNDELKLPPIDNHYAVAVAPDPASFTFHQHDCATAASLRAYVMHIYFVANNNNAGDGVPTLKRAELGAGGAFTIVPLVEGIEDLQFEYGLDTDANSNPNAFTADPGTYNGCAADPCYIANWMNAVTVKVHVLSRSVEASPSFTNSKTYPLGPVTDGPFNDGFKRHAYSGSIRMNNPAGRRES
jgi:type IV pilus assembly protein PilW